MDDPGNATGARQTICGDTTCSCLETATGWVGDFRVGMGMGAASG